MFFKGNIKGWLGGVNEGSGRESFAICFLKSSAFLPLLQNEGNFQAGLPPAFHLAHTVTQTETYLLLGGPAEEGPAFFPRWPGLRFSERVRRPGDSSTKVGSGSGKHPAQELEVGAWETEGSWGVRQGESPRE